MKRYKVFVYTESHPHVSEMIVAGTSEAEARERALNHVRANNPNKGEHSVEESQALSEVRSIQETGVDGCLVVNKLTVKACREMGMNL